VSFAWDDLTINSTATLVALVVPYTASSSFLKGAVSVVQTSANVVDALSVWVGCFHESHPLATVSRPSGLCHVIDWKSQVPLFLHISDVTWVLTNGKSTQRTHQLGTSVVGKLFFAASNDFSMFLDPQVQALANSVWFYISSIFGFDITFVKRT